MLGVPDDDSVATLGLFSVMLLLSNGFSHCLSSSHFHRIPSSDTTPECSWLLALEQHHLWLFRLPTHPNATYLPQLHRPLVDCVVETGFLVVPLLLLLVIPRFVGPQCVALRLFPNATCPRRPLPVDNRCVIRPAKRRMAWALSRFVVSWLSRVKSCYSMRSRRFLQPPKRILSLARPASILEATAPRHGHCC